MKTPNNLLTLLSIFALLTASGCDFGNQDRKAGKGTEDLTFVDASKGLPSNGLWRQGLGFYDMNGDGYMDIVAPRPRKASEEYKGPVVWHGNGKGEWTKSLLDVPPDTAYNYGSISVSDFDGDGIPDIALAMHCLGLKILKGTGNGKYVDFSDGIPPASKFVSRALVSADFNNDGISDIAAVSEARFGKAFPNPSGVWVCCYADKSCKCTPAANEEEASGLFADQLVAGDVNGDGNTDIAIASLVKHKNLIVWIGDGKGGFSPFNKGLPQEKIYFSVALEDLNKDGRDDLVANVSGFGTKGFMGLKAFLSKPDGFDDISEGLPVKEAYTAVDACDLDGDGTAEIIGGTAEGGLKIFAQKGNRWVEVNAAGLPREGMKKIYGVYCIDLNGDGYKDIAVNYASQHELGGIRVFLNVP